MAFILSIDTAVESAGVCLAEDGHTLAFRENSKQKDHASWTHTAILQLLQETGLERTALHAVAVTSGPGSYTGLRVGLATAKGLCYALKIPLITENTLRVIAYAVKSAALEEDFGVKEVKGTEAISRDAQDGHGGGRFLPTLICPMIDARRMEVFTAVYDTQLQETLKPSASILEPSSFEELLAGNNIIFCGNGSGKWRSVCPHPNARYSNVKYNVKHLSDLAFGKLGRGDFTELAYAEPVYLKNFYTPPQTL